MRPYLSLPPWPGRPFLPLPGPRGEGRDGAADIRMACRWEAAFLASSAVVDCSREALGELAGDEVDGVAGLLGGRMVKEIGADMIEPADDEDCSKARGISQMTCATINYECNTGCLSIARGSIGLICRIWAE